ncbi:MAG: hypothetical protein HYU68_05540 [Bacteroidetes bacterium]|nr:hypothetical protein [Bacteroidota bacterium]
MKKIILFAAIFLFTFCNLQLQAQNIGINATGAAPAASAGLDVDFTNKGLLIPRVALTNVTTYAPVVGAAVTGLLVYSTAAPTGGIGVGYYYWDIAAARWQGFLTTTTPGDAWQTIGNAGLNGGNTTTAGTNFMGTTDNQNIDFRTNNLVRMRVSNLGEFFIGTLNTVLPGDLMNGVSNAAFPWAVNGYSDQDGSGVYGQITGGATGYAAVQGEYYGTAIAGAGVRGTFSVAVGNGSSFNLGASGGNGVQGTSIEAGGYKFGVYGTGGVSTRSGGVIGNDGNFRWGALGYYANNGTDYSVYGFGTAFTTGLAGGKMANPTNPLGDFDNSIGLGIYGGVMGGWVKGLEYGANFSGKRYGAYVDGKTLTNDLYVVLNGDESNERTASYASTSLSVDVNAKGTSYLKNGEAEVKFDDKYAALISAEKPIIVTVTPMGETKGVYIVSVSKEGFKIKENSNGTSNVSFSWMAIAEKAGYENPQISAEILSKEFDVNMDGVMHNDNDTETNGKAIWWNGTDVQFGDPSQIEGIVTAKKAVISKTMPDLARPKSKK